MNFINSVIPGLGFVSLVAVAIVYLYSTTRRGRQDIVRQDNTDLRASNQEIRTERAMLDERLRVQEDQLRNYKELATQTPAVTKLITVISVQSKQNADQHVQVIQEISKLTGQISTLAAAINKSYEGRK